MALGLKGSRKNSYIRSEFVLTASQEFLPFSQRLEPLAYSSKVIYLIANENSEVLSRILREKSHSAEEWNYSLFFSPSRPLKVVQIER